MGMKRSLLAMMALCGLVVANAASAEETRDTSHLPRVLLIGDSICGGYHKEVIRQLEGKAVVVKNEGNAEWSGNGVKRIDEWLGDGKWDIIHFNWGLWDLYGWKYDQEDRSPAAYGMRLDQLVTRMEKTGAKLIWATTTPACPGPEVTMLKRFKKEVVITPDQQAAYRKVALEVMKKHGVEVNDLYGYILPDLEKYSPAPDNVHFTGAGNGHLAKRVIQVLEKAVASIDNK